MRFMFAVLALLFVARGAEAQKLVVWGVGHLSCSEYVEARNLPDYRTGWYDPERNPFIGATQRVAKGLPQLADNSLFQQWAMGFITSYNWANPNSSDLFQQTDVPDVMLWLENYCKEHPLEAFFNAVYELEGSLNWEHTKNLMPDRSQ